jgi:hypothetical protein
VTAKLEIQQPGQAIAARKSPTERQKKSQKGRVKGKESDFIPGKSGVRLCKFEHFKSLEDSVCRQTEKVTERESIRELKSDGFP